MNGNMVISIIIVVVWCSIYFIDLRKEIKQRKKEKPMTSKQFSKTLDHQNQQFETFISSPAHEKILSCTEGLSYGDLD